MDSFNNIDAEKSNLDANIRRARTLIGAGADQETVVEALVVSGVAPGDAFLALNAALIVGDPL